MPSTGECVTKFTPVFDQWRTGGQDDLVGAIAEDLFRRHVADASVNLDVLHLLKLDLPVGGDAPPFRQSGILRRPCGRGRRFQLSASRRWTS